MNRLSQHMFVLLELSSEGQRESPMSAGRCEEQEDSRIIALVEFDMENLQVHVVLSREVIAGRLRELDRPAEIIIGTSERPAPCRLTEQL